MRHPVLHFFFLFLFTPVIGQVNIVTNGSFEETWCGFPYIDGYCHWITPPDDFNTPDGFTNDTTQANCFPCECINDDHTWSGNTYAGDGNHYAGILAYYIQGGQVNGREHIHQELTTPLVGGERYTIGFSAKFGSRSRYIVDHLGLFIADTAIGPTNVFPLNDIILVHPQLDMNQYLGDSTNWTHFSTSYIAEGGEQYITIGNFTPDSLLSVIDNPLYTPTNCLLSDNGAYYFIDDVYILPENDTIGTVDTTASVPLTSPHQLRVSPNPFTDELIIEFSSPVTNAVISLTNISGMEVKKMPDFSGKKAILKRNNLAPGTYFLHIYEEVEHVQKVLLQP